MIMIDDLRVQIAAFGPAIGDLRASMRVEAAEQELAALDAEAAGEGFWNDMAQSQKVLARAKSLRGLIADFNGLQARGGDLAALLELAAEENDESLLEDIEKDAKALQADIEDARLRALLSGEYDACSAILSFHAGAGGTEAQDWNAMLYRMYTRYAERGGFSYKVLDYLDGEEAGVKNATILIEGQNAYGYLKSESGVHRLVRISPFDASGRRHTSFAAVEVMPEISDDIQVDIRDEDLKVDTYRSGGAGGQHVNKTESAIRITHIPTGIVVACQNERSQHQNREVAMRMLRSKLIEIKEREHLDRVEDIKGAQKLIEWGSQIRSYVFMPYTLVKDHRTNHENGNINAVMDGELGGFINAYLRMKAGESKK